jgi:hypothetical protein
MVTREPESSKHPVFCTTVPHPAAGVYWAPAQGGDDTECGCGARLCPHLTHDRYAQHEHVGSPHRVMSRRSTYCAMYIADRDKPGAAETRTSTPFTIVAVDQVIDISGNARRLIAVLTGRLCDGEHLIGEADKRYGTSMSRAMSSPKPTSLGIQDLHALALEPLACSRLGSLTTRA